MVKQRKRPEETDLDQLKHLAAVFLELDIVPTMLSPVVVKHPFTDSGVVGIPGKAGELLMVNLLDDPEALQSWKELCRQQIKEADTPFKIALMITKPYQFAFLKYAAPVLSEQDLAHFLTHAWICTEAPNMGPNLSKRQLLSMFRSIDPQKLMDADEYAVFCELDEVVTVYRGVTPYNEENIRALSWTLDRKTAEWFAGRFGESGTVYEAQISKAHIHAVFLGRGESEVIVDPKHLTDLAAVQEQAQGLEMKF